jgi:hypothetical protein
MSRYVFARDTCSLRAWGLNLRRGDAWHADHPLVMARPDLFSTDPLEVHPRGWVSAVVEQATEAPGERRATKRG